MLHRAVRLLLGGLLAASGCATTAAGPDEVPFPGHTAGSPGLGAHALSFHRVGSNAPTIDTAPMTTERAGSTFIVSVGRGDLGAFELPTDNKGNGPYAQLGEPHPYTLWPSSGTSLYAAASMVGGPDHVVHTATPPSDEITLAAVEVLEGTHVQAVAWNEVLAGSPLRSRSVTTTGPATLVAFWWGDAGVAEDKTAVPNNGFAVIDSVLASGELVQCAVAVKNVAAAGTYDVTWTATPRQGAQLWLVAVQ
ncbi:MAG TPA: hypothetical protein VN253_17320 [Kofleriaceae bacterium]|nr:hypothetical protein [Kofleriaceae bacterium]